MANFKSEEVNINAPAQQVFDKMSNLEALGELIKNAPEDQIPDDQRQMLEQVTATRDSITFPGGPAGNITLRLAEAVSPSLIRMVGQGTPVPLTLSMHITTVNEVQCSAYVDIDIKIPAMLKPMVSGPLQKMSDQFSQMLRSIPFN